jgi:hypothetical protein
MRGICAIIAPVQVVPFDRESHPRQTDGADAQYVPGLRRADDPEAHDQAADWGAAGVIAAAEYVHEQRDTPNPTARPTPEGRETVARLLALADQLRNA